jgi:N-acetyl-anhydromuramyl-L-alanine amidase AmpD
MHAQIRPTRINISDRFPMVAFKILADGTASQAEVAIGADPELFSPDGKKKRTAANFYSTRGNGSVLLSAGEAGFTVPPEVLARFIGNDKLYFGLATSGEGGAMKVSVMPSSSSPYINISGLSGRSMTRVRVLPNRQQRAAGYGKNGQVQLDWAGDTFQPGMTTVGNGGQPATAADPKLNGATPAAPAPYDDGFGPMPGDHVSASTPAANGTPSIDAKSMALQQRDHKISARGLAVPTPDYPGTSRFVVSPAFNKGRRGKTIDRIVIHITAAPTTSSTVNAFTAPGAQASAHYLVGQDGEVVQFVAETDTAWHATVANERSIGIEHVAVPVGGADYPLPNGKKQHYDYLPPTDTQYCESAALVTYLCDKYELTPDRTTIIGHREVDPVNRPLDPDGAWNWDHFMDLVTNRYCAAQPVTDTAQGLSIARQAKPVARAMVAGTEDFDKARKYARDYVDLFKWSPAASVVREIEARGFKVQTLSDAVGDLNLDFYKVKITKFPSGWDANRLLDQFIHNINDFLSSTNTSFEPYEDQDVARLASANPVGTVFYLDIFGPDNAAVVISDKKPQFYAVTTINTPRSGDHPVSGHRQFGYYVEGDATTFYSRGADRATLGFPGTESLTFKGGEILWESFQEKLAAFINDNGGSAEIITPFSERFNPTAVSQEFGGFGVAQSLGTTGSTSMPAFSVNWDEVELIPQQTNFSCWAAAGAMLMGWRDRVSMSPDSVAQVCSRSTASGLLTDDNLKFAAEMGFNAVAPVCYTEEGFRQLLENNGPLWVSEGTPPNLHAIIVTGMYSDGKNSFVRIADPWDRAVGTPGKPGGYDSTHATGSRYIMSWEDFTTQYEAAMTGNPPNRQILHSGNPNGLTPNTTVGTPPAGYAQSYQSRKPKARAMGGGQSFTINWDDVQQIAQPTKDSCWATAASMVLGWRDSMSVSVESVTQRAGMNIADRLDEAAVGQFATNIGLIAEPPQSYTVEGFRKLIENNGPLWVGASVPDLHVIVVTGLYSDGEETYVRVTDPWDRDIGVPGAPGARKATFVTGSRYIMRWADFVAEYERAATDFSRVNLQILHCGGVAGHVANIGATTPVGYAMSSAEELNEPENDSSITLFPPPPPRARALDAISAVSAIGGLLPQILSDRSGDISWDLDQFHGLKHPSDKVPASPALFTDAPTIRLDDWPKLALYGVDDICAWFTVDWQHNGKSLGNVRIGNVGSNAALGMKLKVRAQIMDDNILYEPGGIAALRIRFHYLFSRKVGSDIIALTELQLFADGTHLRESKWLQKSTI